MRIEQGDADATVFKTFTDQLVADYRQAGVRVTYKSYPDVSHGGDRRQGREVGDRVHQGPPEVAARIRGVARGPHR